MEGTPAVPIPPLSKYKGVASVAAPPVIVINNGVSDYDPEKANFKHNLKYQLLDDENKPYIEKEYLIVFPDKKGIRGTTDAQGYTSDFYTNDPENIIIHLLGKKINTAVVTDTNENGPPTKHSLQYQLMDDDGNPYANTKYKVVQPTGITTDMTDNEGFTKYFSSDNPESVFIHVLKD